MMMMTPPEYDLLLSAAKNNDVNHMKTLILDGGGVPPSHSNGIGQTALHVACIWGNIEAIEFLITHGANVNAANSLMGATPLHTVMHGCKSPSTTNIQYRIVKLLMNAGANAGLEDNNKKVPIDYLEVGRPHYAQLKVLLKRSPRDYSQLFVNDAISGLGRGGCRVIASPP